MLGKKEQVDKRLYAEVIVPVKFRYTLTYGIPPELAGKVETGSIVSVTLIAKKYAAIVLSISDVPAFSGGQIKDLDYVYDYVPVSRNYISFLRSLSDYYMCLPGQVFKFALPVDDNVAKKSRKSQTGADRTERTGEALPELSQAQAVALEKIMSVISGGGNVLLKGVTGSGKTEIYMHAAKEAMSRGRNVLYLLPEIAISRQIEQRLKKIFPQELIIYHSKQTSARKRDIYRRLTSYNISSADMVSKPYILLGTRSAVLLPHSNLGLIIVDEEHDYSYKQTDPAPRYNGRDAALMLGAIEKVPVLLGSATPSLETQYNIHAGKIAQVELNCRFYGGGEAPIRIVDMRKEKNTGSVTGPFSNILINAIRDRLAKGEQTLVFRSRRAYATMLECPECGYIPVCPDCAVPLSYHKFNNTLSCHYCGYRQHLDGNLCPKCSKAEYNMLGEGTERIEEQLREIFPEAVIERFDTDITSSITREKEILQRFSEGKIDILVGTQMISKGFDFSGLTLAAVIKAESITSVIDFRADEKALQLLRQLRGRVARRGNSGEMIIQTARKDHPVFRMLCAPEIEEEEELMRDREELNYPPFVRIIRLIFKSKSRKSLDSHAAKVCNLLDRCGCHDYLGPVPPVIDKIENEHIVHILIKLRRDKQAAILKRNIFGALSKLETPGTTTEIDVDPVNI
ncbi:MAG: primosomal protein N' [Candidatus Coprenecus sp.]|nr:primosomal protein N' [Candidatus Coprenecus sp.]